MKPDAALRERVLRVLADPARARALMDVVSSGADDITKTLDAEGTPGRAQVLAAFEWALRRFESDATLSRNDRLGALYARVLLARLDQPKGPSTSRCPSRCSRRCASTWPVSIARSPPAMSARR